MARCRVLDAGGGGRCDERGVAAVGEFRDFGIDAGGPSGVREHAVPPFPIAVKCRAAVERVGVQSRIPQSADAAGVCAHGVVVPAIGALSFGVVRVAERDVEIPNRPRLDFSRAGFVPVGAENVAVDLLRELHGELRVDERRHINPRSVAGRWIAERCAVQGGLECIDVERKNVELLGGVNLGIMRLHADGLRRCGVPCSRACVGFVAFENISAAEHHRVGDFIVELLDIGAIFPAREFFHDGVNAAVILVADCTAVLIEEHFDLPCPRREVVGAHVAHHRKHEVISHHAFVRERAVEHPVGVRGHAEDADVFVHVVAVPHFPIIRALGEARGAFAVDFRSSAACVIRERREARAAGERVGVDDDARGVAKWTERTVLRVHIRAETVENNDGDIRTEDLSRAVVVRERGIHHQERACARVARQPARSIDAGLEIRARGDGKRRGVNRRAAGGRGVVERVSDDGSGREWCGDGKGSRGGDDSAFTRPHDVLGFSSLCLLVRAASGCSRCWREQVAERPAEPFFTVAHVAVLLPVVERRRDGIVRANEREVAASISEFEVGVQPARRIREISRGGEDDLVFVRRERDGWKRPADSACDVREPPACEIRARILAVVNLDPVGILDEVILEPAVIFRDEFRNHRPAGFEFIDGRDEQVIDERILRIRARRAGGDSEAVSGRGRKTRRRHVAANDLPVVTHIKPGIIPVDRNRTRRGVENESARKQRDGPDFVRGRRRIDGVHDADEGAAWVQIDGISSWVRVASDRAVIHRPVRRGAGDGYGGPTGHCAHGRLHARSTGVVCNACRRPAGYGICQSECAAGKRRNLGENRRRKIRDR